MSILIFQNVIAMHQNDGIDIIIAHVLSDIRPIGPDKEILFA